MKKLLILFSILMFGLSLFCANLQADRKSYDEVTGTNSAYNNYIQDVIGNKLDTTNGNSIMGKLKYTVFIVSNSGTLSISNLNLGRTNANRNAITISDGITNEKLLRTNQNRISLIQSDGVTNETLLRTNQNRIDLMKATNYSLLLTNNNRLSIIQSDGVTNEKILKTNQNRLSLIQISEGTNYSLLLTNNNRLTIIQSDGVSNESLLQQIKLTNYSLLLTNGNRMSIIQSDGASNETWLKQIRATNQSLLLTNNNRLTLIQSDGVTNEKILKTNQNRLHILDEHIHSVSKVYPTMAAGAGVGSSGTVWTVSNNYTNVIVPVNTITSIFDLHYISIENISANSINEIIFYNMTLGTELGRVRISKTAVQEQVNNVMIMTPLIPANAKIGARMGSSVADTTVTLSVFYHTYD